MRFKRGFICLVAFFLGFAFYLASADVNLWPPFDSGQGGSYRCDSTGNKDCYYNQSIPDPDPDTHQAFQGNYATTLEETFGNSSHLMVESCLTQFGWMAGNVASCRRIVDMNVFPFAAFIPVSWSDNNNINLGYLNDLNYLSVHIYVNNIYTNTNGTAYGRRVYINNFSFSPASINVGDPFTVSWGTDNGVNLANFLYSGPINCGPSGNVGLNGSSNCTATGAGTAQVEIQVYGPGGDGPIMVNEIRSINIGSPTHLECISNTCSVVSGSGANQCSPAGSACGGGRFKCTGSGSGCAWDPNDSGPNQCSPPNDSVCLAPTHLACQSNACVSVAGSGPNTCNSNADCGGGGGDGSACIGITAPNSVNTGQTFSAVVAMQNTGGTTWDPFAQYKLGSQVGATWGTQRAYLNGSVSSGQSTNISFDATAPSLAGTYQFDWKMLQEGVQWFGATCTKAITVNDTGGTHLACQSNACVSVAGSGPNICNTNADCGGGASHLECISNTCSVVSGSGANQCSPAGSSCGSLPSTHLACQSNACVSVAGSGSNLCSSDVDCAPPVYTIEGWVWEASTANDTGFDGPPNEPGWGGMRVFLNDQSGNQIAYYDTPTTGSNTGYFAFVVPSGNYSLLLNPSQIPVGYTITTGSNPFPMTVPVGGCVVYGCIVHNFGLYIPKTLSIDFTATPNSGPSPLSATLNAKVTGGTATGTMNYSFWWNCPNPTTDVGVAQAACGDLPSPGNLTCASNSYGFKCNGVDFTSYSPTVDVTWNNPNHVNVLGNRITKNSGGNNWNAGASSNQSIASGDGFMEFSTSEANTNKMAGLSKGDGGWNFPEIKYAFYPQSGGSVAEGGTLVIEESGSSAGSFGTYTSYEVLPQYHDIFRIAIESGLVKYYKNGGSPLHTSVFPVTASDYPLLLDTSLYSYNPASNEFASVINAKITQPQVYNSTSIAKVIIERGTASPQQAQRVITITGPAPSVSNNTVTVSNSNYCSAGVHATVGWTYVPAGSPPQSNQVAYQVQIDDDDDPLAGNPEWEQSGTTGTSAVTTPCNPAINPVDSPQTNCRMTWNTLYYRAWVRVQNGYGEWSPWTQMVTYCNGSLCGPATSWTTPAHQPPELKPDPGFSITPLNPALGVPVIFDDLSPTFNGSATFGSWSWNFGDGSITNGTDATIPLDVAGTNHTYVANGNYTVRLTVEDELGISCSNSSLISIQKAIPRWREIAPR